MEFEIRVIKLPDSVLHLDKALMVLGTKRIFYRNELISKEEIEGFEGIEISCGGNTTVNIICLGDNELIVNRSK